MAVDDDLILTLSDDDVPDEESEDDVAPQEPPQGKKRKRETKPQNPIKKQREDKDADLESDFEFENEGGVPELDLDSWALAPTTSKDVDIDKLVAKRRGAVQDAPATEDEISSEHSSDESDEEGGRGYYDEDDTPGTSADEEFHTAIEGVHGENGEDASGAASEGEDDNTEIAAPVPHPDDLEPDPASEDEEDAIEKEKQNAFFANDEKPAKMATPSAFQSMHIHRAILKGIAAVGFSKPTPIQAKTIPVALEGKDLVGGAVTGSGKTAAFLIPILDRLFHRPKGIKTSRVAILMPTRELALQCFQVAKKLAAFTDITFGQAIGGLNSREQEKQLRLRPDIVIATPGRFIDLERNTSALDVSTIEILVLDEADRMLEEGFADELNEILSKIPKSRQTMLFSATMTSKVDDLIRVGLQRPVRLMVDAQKQTVSGLTQEFVRLRPGREAKRLAYLMYLCHNVYTERVIIFFRQKKEAHRVRVIFALCGLKAAELHGSMSQEQRMNAMETFRSGKASYLLATDLASRGLDIKGIDTVINYEAPQTYEIYLHRVGRTARAGRSGIACTLAAEPDRKVVKAAVKSGKEHKAIIKQRTIDASDVDAWHTKLEGMHDEIEAVLREEKEERALQQTDRDLAKAENIVKYEDEIKARPKKTWFESEKDKLAAKQKGRVVLNGPEDEVREKKKKVKLSNKDRKRLQDKDDRRAGMEWRKGKASTLAGKATANAKKGKVTKGKAKGRK